MTAPKSIDSAIERIKDLESNIESMLKILIELCEAYSNQESINGIVVKAAQKIGEYKNIK